MAATKSLSCLYTEDDSCLNILFIGKIDDLPSALTNPL